MKLFSLRRRLLTIISDQVETLRPTKQFSIEGISGHMNPYDLLENSALKQRKHDRFEKVTATYYTT